jgi:hypothetical protein
VGQSYEARSAAYFHSNCSHCHHPQGVSGRERELDFRYFGAGLQQLVCKVATGGSFAGETYINPDDDLDLSLIYRRDAAREGDGSPANTQMPPVATLIPDTRQLKITADWINSLTNTCP